MWAELPKELLRMVLEKLQPPEPAGPLAGGWGGSKHVSLVSREWRDSYDALVTRLTVPRHHLQQRRRQTRTPLALLGHVESRHCCPLHLQSCQVHLRSLQLQLCCSYTGARSLHDPIHHRKTCRARCLVKLGVRLWGVGHVQLTLGGEHAREKKPQRGPSRAARVAQQHSARCTE